MKSFKKALALVLSVVMLVSVMAVPSFAASSVTKTSIKGAKVTVKTVTYNGKQQTAKVTNVTLNGKTLPTSEYKVTTVKKTNAGTYDVKVTGINKHSGTATGKWTISPAKLTSVTLTKSSKTYTGSKIAISVQTVEAGKLKVSPSGYTYSPKSVTKAGKYTVTVKGKGNFTGTAKATFTVNKAKLTSASLTRSSATYTGSNIKISVKTVKVGRLKVSPDGYTYSPTKAKNSGKYTVKVTGKGNFTGTAKATFTVKAKAKKAISVTAKASKTSLKASDLKKKAKAVTVSLTYKKNKGDKNAPVTITCTSSNKKNVTISGKKITFKKGAKKGTYKFSVKIGAYNNYKGATKTITIKVK